MHSIHELIKMWMFIECYIEVLGLKWSPSDSLLSEMCFPDLPWLSCTQNMANYSALVSLTGSEEERDWRHTQLMRRNRSHTSVRMSSSEHVSCLSHWNSSTASQHYWRLHNINNNFIMWFHVFSLMNDFRIERFVIHSLWCVFVFVIRLKAAEESFRQVKEKATYSIKPKHASGIVRVFLHSWQLWCRRLFVCLFVYICLSVCVSQKAKLGMKI